MFSQALTPSPLPAQPLRLVELAALAVVRDALAEVTAETCLYVGKPTQESLMQLGILSDTAETVASNWPCFVFWSFKRSTDHEAEPPAAASSSAGAPLGVGEAGAVDKAGAGVGEAGAPAGGGEAGGGEAGAGGGEAPSPPAGAGDKRQLTDAGDWRFHADIKLPRLDDLRYNLRYRISEQVSNMADLKRLERIVRDRTSNLRFLSLHAFRTSKRQAVMADFHGLSSRDANGECTDLERTEPILNLDMPLEVPTDLQMQFYKALGKCSDLQSQLEELGAQAKAMALELNLPQACDDSDSGVEACAGGVAGGGEAGAPPGGGKACAVGKDWRDERRAKNVARAEAAVRDLQTRLEAWARELDRISRWPPCRAPASTSAALEARP